MSINYEDPDQLPEIPYTNILILPNDIELQNFISVNDIKIDPATIPASGDILDASGVVTFKLHFYLKTKTVADNNINKIKFSLYNRNPGTTARIEGSSGASDIVNPIKTLIIGFKSEIQFQKYNISFSNEQYNSLPVVSVANAQPYVANRALNTSILNLDSEESIFSRVIFSSLLDPTDYINWKYFPDDVDISNSGAVIIDKSRDLINSNYISLSSDRRQRKLSQKNPESFIRNSDINFLYLSAPESVGSPGPDLQKLSVSSDIKEYQIFFNVKMSDIDIRSLDTIFLDTQLIDENDFIRSSLRSNKRILQQIQGHIAPAAPASIKLSSRSSNENTLLIKQNDYLANTVTINRMIINPSYPHPTDVKSIWTQVAQIPLKASDSSISYVDAIGSTVIHPNVVVYEAVSSGAGGSKCPVSKKVVCSGKKRNIALKRSSRRKTHCTITSQQGIGDSVIIRVSDVPPNISRITLRRQLLSTSLVQNDSRYHDVIKTSSGNDSHFIGSQDADYEFIDNNVQDRAIYKYYVEFDSIDGRRTESACDEVVEFRVPPSSQSSIQSGISSPQTPSPGNLTTSFTLEASFNSTGLNDLNRLLENQGISDLFKSDLRQDRNQISSLLIFEVTRKNARTGDRIIWPSVSPGQFIDSNATREITGRRDAVLIPGDTYVYTAKLLLLNPETLFTSAKTAKVTADGLRKIEISAKKFAENFSLSPGKMQSPTTIAREATRSFVPGSYYTGISHTITVKVPKTLTPILNLRATRSSGGRPANVIRWNLPDDNIKRTIYCFRVDVITNRDTLTPLMTVSPNATTDGISYEVRDEINVGKVFPVQYRVSTILSDMSRDAGLVTGEIINKASYPMPIVLDILSRRR